MRAMRRCSVSAMPRHLDAEAAPPALSRQSLGAFLKHQHARLKLSDARVTLGEHPPQLRDLLAIEHQGEELTGRDAVGSVARRKQQPAIDFPIVPAIPGHEAREDRQQTHGRRLRAATSQPGADGSWMDADHRSGIGGAQMQALKKRAQGGRISREARGQQRARIG